MPCQRTEPLAPEAQTASSRAAQYLRMSTEHQKYSTENQAHAIAKYAEQHGLTIVRTYQDDGKSGLHLKGRAALQQLIADARSGTCDFTQILVYDVSRWGRFQDVDESAYYEFLCKETGLAIHYCAEQFVNDGSMIAALTKGLKRAMAAEYSRELSVKVFAGQCRIVAKGYRLGGKPGFGLRRLLVDQHGNPKIILQAGESKNLTTDRVVLIPGPAAEVALVRRIFKLFVSEKLSVCGIARKLNSQGAVRKLGRNWTRNHIWRLLKDEKYIGNNVFNRQSKKLQQKSVRNPLEMWVRVDDCFSPVVEKKSFLKANQIIKDRAHKRGNEQYLLDCLRTLLAKRGRLSRAIISSNKRGPSADKYRRYFGNVTAAYQLIGYTQTTAPRILARKNNGQFVKLPRSAASKVMARNAARTRAYRARLRESNRRLSRCS